MKTDRNDRYPRAASVLHAFADPPYGFYIFNASVRRAAMRPYYTVSLCSPLDGCRGFALHCYNGLLGSSQKSNQTPHAARLRCSLLAARCSVLDARCSMLDRYRFPVRKKRAWWGSASSGAAAPRIKMLGADRLNTAQDAEKPWVAAMVARRVARRRGGR
jgi:hypothetical protein